jgi:murein DD-endopeptidase MepM/ murein hydrolase activator NlpD
MTLKSLLVTLLITIATFFGSEAQALEIRICEHEIRTSLFSDERGVHSALIQGFAVVNRTDDPVRVTGVTFNLKNREQVLDTRWLVPADISNAVKQAPQIAFLDHIFPAQFCNGQLLAEAKLAASDMLAPSEAIIFLYQPFIWKGERDAIEIAVETSLDTQLKTVRIVLPIVPGASKTKALFPVAGRSFVAVAASFHTPHRWAGIEEFAYDIVAFSGGGSTYRGDGAKLGDYAIFGKPVRAVAGGKVVAVLNDQADNAAMLKREGEADDAYLARLLEGQTALLAKGMASVLGNHVVIDHGNGEFSIYAHLKQGSARITLGASVAAGETIGAVGSSGNSTEPHLHFQICDGPDIAACRPIPASFTNYRLPLELGPRTIQSGDVVETVK